MGGATFRSHGAPDRCITGRVCRLAGASGPESQATDKFKAVTASDRLLPGLALAGRAI